jgi:hypothetical protein
VKANDGRRGHKTFLGQDSRLHTAFQASPAKTCTFFVEPDAAVPVGVWAIRLDCTFEAVTEREMAPLQTNRETISQDMVTKVGSAAGLVARIQQDYAVQAESEPAEDAREALASKARAAAEQVIDEQGISIQDYNAVLTAAEHDQDLERRLLDAAREVL